MPLALIACLPSEPHDENCMALSVPKPGSESRHLYTGHHMANKQEPAILILGKVCVPSFDVTGFLSMRRQWFTFVRLSNPYMTCLSHAF